MKAESDLSKMQSRRNPYASKCGLTLASELAQRTDEGIDIGSLVGAREVDDADVLVSTDPEIMGGAPCFTGTRVPIDTVLASLDRGIGMAELRESFRFLTDTHLSAARVYAAVHPRRGWPQPLGEMNPQTPPLSFRIVRPARA